MRSRGELEYWLWPQVEEWVQGVRTLAKITKQHLQSAYFGLVFLLQLEWQYLQRTVTGVVDIVGPNSFMSQTLYRVDP